MRLRTVLAPLLFVFGLQVATYSQGNQEPECPKKVGRPGAFRILNLTGFDIELRLVSKECKEVSRLPVGEDKYIDINGFANNIYRVYQNMSDRFLTTVTLEHGKRDYEVRGFDFEPIPLNEKVCSREGDPRLFFIKNASPFTIRVSYVGTDCVEIAGPKIEAGKSTGGKSFANNVFHVYRDSDGSLIDRVIVRPVGRDYYIGGNADSDPRKSFIETVNALRTANNIGPLELDETLNKSCEWFANFMAERDLQKAGHLLSEFGKGYPKDMNEPSQRLRHFSLKGSSASDSAEATSVIRTSDYDRLGAFFATEWTSSPTHFRPFYDAYRTKFSKVGFAVAKSPSDPKMFYGCAIFANP